MATEQEVLWNSIQEFQLDDMEATSSFTDRLCRENGWKYEYAVRVIHEYKRFVYLICISEHPLTPSDQVDQVWHLHLLYTRSYWIDFCKNTLGRDIHHGPTKGGNQEKNKYRNWYYKTKTLYLKTYHKPAPMDIWPSSKIRFGEVNFRRINLHRNWIFPRFKKQ